MSEFLSLSVTATLLGASERTVQRQINSGKYTTRQVSGRGGLRYEIALSSLPEDAQNRYHAEQFNSDIAVLKTSHVAAVVADESGQHSQKTIVGGSLPAVITDLSDCTFQQREIDLAITVIFRFIDQFDGSEAAAIRHINTEYSTRNLPDSLLHALDHAKEKKRIDEKLILSAGLVQQWKKRKALTGSYAPKKKHADNAPKAWHSLAIELYRRPQKPTYAFVVEKLAEVVSPAPDYFQVRHFFLNQFSQSELLKGRNAGMKLRSLQHYTKRTAAGMVPWQEVHADGWATHFTAPHPITGDYVTLEVWDLHDVATRYVPPFAIGLTENYEVIAKAIENAIRDQGVMAILQTDSTRIVKRNTKFTGNPVLSISDRAGITIVHPQIVGNAQANGISENFHTWLDKQSRELTTYQAKNMDSLTLRRTQKLTGKLIKAKAKNDLHEVDILRRQLNKNGILLESFAQACDWLEAMRSKWNNHAHSALKKVRDNTTGKLRHQSPLEALNEFKANGWEPVTMTEELIVDLFRPRVLCKVRRGVVTPYSKDVRFRASELSHWEGKEVAVSYDIMDYSQVWVMDLKGSLICVALYCPETSYRATNAYEVAIEKRAVSVIKNHERHISLVKARTGLVIDTTADVIDMKLSYVEFDEIEPPEKLTRIEYEEVEPEAPLKSFDYNDYADFKDVDEEAGAVIPEALPDVIDASSDDEITMSASEVTQTYWGDEPKEPVIEAEKGQ